MSGELATYLIRSLLSEGRLRYQTVTIGAGGPEPKLIEREGPTGLLLTTTAVNLHPENETRLFSIPVTDTREQTRKILEALGEEDQADADVSAWHALQEWIGAGSGEVTVPFARALVDAIPESALAVRLRRDFPALLNLIRAHALLHQASRERDVRRRTIATIEDYAVVRALVADILSEGLEATVSPTVRETVEAIGDVRGGGEIRFPSEAGATSQSVAGTQVADRLGIDKSSAQRRIKQAVAAGYLVNLEERKGRPYKLILGNPMPEDIEILPTPERLQGCMIDQRERSLSPDAHRSGLSEWSFAGGEEAVDDHSNCELCGERCIANLHGRVVHPQCLFMEPAQ